MHMSKIIYRFNPHKFKSRIKEKKKKEYILIFFRVPTIIETDTQTYGE